ncbi:MAG: response regulator [Deltaproteobacteria bacterium]|jgi:DNA-binding NtrC family response regulator|nr:response regulator [Deltaproteobacteria bacterium]PNV87068.1 MAG: response regulator [Desulfobacteraceae bacterium]MDH3774752.1 response regulator [Deltaproteobacteria bacterium]MDH3802128.1 response regulator [Deltaproteobacteria bacterium]MDH3851327.1 response regulator [Deltaproteobacteria bacterium]
MNEDRKTQILILDDEPIVWKRLKPALEKAGYEVEAFTQSSSAMRRVQEKEFDIVVTDLKMEGVDGMEFLTDVKTRSPKTEVIVITGFATMETAKESFQKGVFDFVAKPFKRGELLEIIRKAEAKVFGK